LESTKEISLVEKVLGLDGRWYKYKRDKRRRHRTVRDKPDQRGRIVQANFTNVEKKHEYEAFIAEQSAQGVKSWKRLREFPQSKRHSECSSRQPLLRFQSSLPAPRLEAQPFAATGVIVFSLRQGPRVSRFQAETVIFDRRRFPYRARLCPPSPAAIHLLWSLLAYEFLWHDQAFAGRFVASHILELPQPYRECSSRRRLEPLPQAPYARRRIWSVTDALPRDLPSE
jgi:hypothetical protein